MKKSRRETIANLLMIAMLLFTVTSSLTWTACSVTTVLAEGEKILSYMPLAVNIALPLVCIDVTICPAAKLAATAFDAAQAAALTFFQQWQAASSAAQPGLLAQFQAALNVLQQQYNNLLTALRVTNSTIVGVVGTILAAILSGISEIASLTGTVLSAGGTSAAAMKIRRGFGMKTGPVSLTSSDFKAAVLKAVKTKTSDENVNAQLKLLQAQVNGW
jgi:hypothetical protein